MKPSAARRYFRRSHRLLVALSLAPLLAPAADVPVASPIDIPYAAGATSPAMASDATGELAVAWVDGVGKGMPNVFLQRFGSDGKSRGEPVVVGRGRTQDPAPAPSLAMAASGAFVLAWNGVGVDGTDQDAAHVRVLRFAPDGSAIGDAIVADTGDGASPGHAPRIAIDADGAFVVGWDASDGTGHVTGLFQRAFDANGVARSRPRAVTGGPGLRMGGLGMLPHGSFVATWSERPNRTASLFLQVFTRHGQPTGTPVVLATDLLDAHEVPALSSLPDGRFAVAWPTADGVHLQRFGADAAANGAETFVAVPQGAFTPAVLLQPRDDVRIAWQQGDDFLIHQTRIVSGQAASPIVADPDDGAGEAPVLAAAPAGDAFLAWNGATAVGTGGTLHVQRFGDRPVRAALTATDATDDTSPDFYRVTVTVSNASDAGRLDGIRLAIDGAADVYFAGGSSPSDGWTCPPASGLGEPGACAFAGSLGPGESSAVELALESAGAPCAEPITIRLATNEDDRHPKSTTTIARLSKLEAPRIVVARPAYRAAENSLLTIRVRREGACSQEAVVNARTVDGTATGGADYGAVSELLDWATGDTRPRTIVIPIFQDSAAEKPETFTLDLQALDGLSVVEQASTPIRIRNVAP